MHIHLASNIWNPYNADLVDALNRSGTAATHSYKSDPAKEGRSWKPNSSGFKVGLLKEISLLRRQRPTIALHSGSYAAGTELLRALYLTKLADEVSWWGERPRSASAGKDLYRKGFLRAGKSSVLAIGSIAAAAYRELVPDSVPVHEFPYVRALADTRARTTADFNEPTVGFVGSLIERKGCDVALTSIAQIPESERPTFDVIGDGPERPRLEEMARRMGVKARFLGWVAPHEVAAHRMTWELQVVPSRYDGWGLVVQESLGSNVPVLASDQTGAAHDLLRAGITGVMSPLANFPEALSHSLTSIREGRYGDRPRSFASLISADRAAIWLSTMAASGPANSESRSFVQDAWQEYLRNATHSE